SITSLPLPLAHALHRDRIIRRARRSRPTNAVSPCTRHRRLITVPAHYGFFRSPGRRRCFALPLSVFYILRKASPWTDAGKSEGTTRSSKGLVECSRTTF